MNKYNFMPNPGYCRPYDDPSGEWYKVKDVEKARAEFMRSTNQIIRIKDEYIKELENRLAIRKPVRLCE